MNIWEPVALAFADTEPHFTAMQLECHLERSGFIADLGCVSRWIRARVDDNTLSVDTSDCPRRFYKNKRAQ